MTTLLECHCEEAARGFFACHCEDAEGVRSNLQARDRLHNLRDCFGTIGHCLAMTVFVALFLFVSRNAFSQEEATQETAPAEAPPAETPPAEPTPTETPPAQEEPAETVAPAFTPFGGEQQVVPGELGIEERVTLDLRNIDVVDALRFLALKGNLDLAISKNVQGRLMLLLNDVPIRDVLDIILLTNELAYDKQGDIFNIMTEDEYKTRYGRRFSDARKVRLFKLKYAIPDQVFNMLDALKSDVGRVLVDQESGTALVIDSEQALARMEEAVASLEQKRSVSVFSLRYAKAADVEERLKKQLDDKNAGSITADPRTNQVIVQTYPERMLAIEALVGSLDQKTKEVLIVSKIIKVTLSDDFTADVKWEGFFKEFGFIGKNNKQSFLGNHPRNNLARAGTSFMDDFISITPTTRPTEGAKNFLTENMVFGMAGEDNWEALLKYLRTIGNTRVLSSPKIMVVNNQEAKIHVGEKEAYVTTTTTTGQTTTTTAESVTFIDIGIQLNVTPTINDDGYITMKIKPEISSVSRTLVTPSNNRIPIVDTSIAETTVMVKDGTSIIIGGLRKDENVLSEKRIPLFGDILGEVPLVGRLFKNKTETKRRTEILVLLTPHLVAGDRFITGEPGPASQSMKPYRDYSTLSIKPKEEGDSALVSFFKKIPFFGRD